MKKLCALLFALLLMLLSAACIAEETDTPLLRLFNAECDLLLDTKNVTMTGHAVFTLNGKVFKTADLTQLMDGRYAVRDWLLTTPFEGEDDKQTGYTVVTMPGIVYAINCRAPKLQIYYIEPTIQRQSILNRSSVLDQLLQLGRYLLRNPGLPGECVKQDGSAISITIGEENISEPLNNLLNLLMLQGVKRYSGIDMDLRNMAFGDLYAYYTVTEGIVYSTEVIRLTGLTLTASLDDEGRILSVEGEAALLLRDSIEEYPMTITFRQEAKDYGTTFISEDPMAYDRWGASDYFYTMEADEPEESPYERAAEVFAALPRDNVMLDLFYINPENGSKLHIDPYCPSVNSAHLPLTPVVYEPALPDHYQPCEFCFMLDWLDKRPSAVYRSLLSKGCLIDKATGNNTFSMPPKDIASMPNALREAFMLLSERYELTPDAIERFSRIEYGYNASPSDFRGPYWQFDLYLPSPNEEEFYEIIINADDHSILYAACPEEGNG